MIPPPSLPAFATSLSSRLQVPSLVLVAAPGAWKHIRIPLDLIPSEIVGIRGVLSVGGGDSNVPLPAVPKLVFVEDLEGEISLGSPEGHIEGYESGKPLAAYATFTVGPYTFMFVPPTPDGLGIPPDYDALTLAKDAEIQVPSLYVRSGHKLAVGRKFPLTETTVRIGGLVDLEVPLFRCTIPRAATLRWTPSEAAYAVTSDAPGQVTLRGEYAPLGFLTFYGELSVAGWDFILQRPTARRIKTS